MSYKLVGSVLGTSGMLPKAWYVDNIGNYYLVKGNSCFDGVIGYEPISEVIAYKIAVLLGIPCVPYRLGYAKDFPEVVTYGVDYVSMCPKIETKGIFYPYEVYITNLGYDLNDCINAYIDLGLNLEFLAKLVCFDAFIGNKDRHLSNLGVIVTSGGVVNSPIYDNGASLLSWENDDNISKLVSTDSGVYNDDSKMVFSSHSEEVTYIKSICAKCSFGVNKGNSARFLARVKEVCSDELLLLPYNRRIAIMKYLEARVRYLYD